MSTHRTVQRQTGGLGAGLLWLALVVTCWALLKGCSDTRVPLTKPIIPTGFANLPALDRSRDGHYTLWAVIGGSPTWAGNFLVDGNDRLLNMDGVPIAGFEVIGSVAGATHFLVSLEPSHVEAPRRSTATPRAFVPSSEGFDATPSYIFLSGEVKNKKAVLGPSFTFGGTTRTEVEYSGATGLFVAATPTESPADRTLSGQAGIWFTDTQNGTPGLTLPPLSTRFTYRGWLLTDSGPLEIGGFPADLTNVGQILEPGRWPDDFSVYSGTSQSPLDPLRAYPGEDFLFNSPDPARFKLPLKVAGKGVLVSIDPAPMTRPLPFIPLLTAPVPVTVVPRVQRTAMLNLFGTAGGSRYPRGTVSVP
ncbi:MAG: hypothetical protein HY815_03460 [Candidatus Riflebacteria bacterium]|nr:hypothetical protein [Candidatus Riflebacteria bacterium]